MGSLGASNRATLHADVKCVSPQRRLLAAPARAHIAERHRRAPDRHGRVLYARFENHHYRIWCFACRKCAGIYLSVNNRPPMGSLCSSGREIARTASMGREWYRADHAARHARADLPTNPGHARLSRGDTKTGRELRSQVQARSASSASVAAVSKQVRGAWWLAGPLERAGGTP